MLKSCCFLVFGFEGAQGRALCQFLRRRCMRALLSKEGLCPVLVGPGVHCCSCLKREALCFPLAVAVRELCKARCL